MLYENEWERELSPSHDAGYENVKQHQHGDTFYDDNRTVIVS